MPLRLGSSSSVISGNISEFHKGPTYAHTAAKFGKERANKQAIAVALSEARRSSRANGGVIGYQIGGGVTPGVGMITGVPPRAPGVAPPPMPLGMPPPQMMPPGVASPMMNPMVRPMMRAVGGFNMAKGPNLSPPNYFERGEARDMMHGPLMTASPGRADTHYTKVPSGSYVLPAAHIASMGQGNSMAGLKLAQSQFGLNGPYGIGAMKMGRGPGAPRPPRPMGGLGGFATGGYTSEGGARGHGHHQPVDVALSGGEYIVHPIVVRNIGGGSLENGHKILDSYILHARKREIETLKRLPPPAKK